MPSAHRPTPLKAARQRQPFLPLLQFLLLASLLLGLSSPAQAARTLSYDARGQIQNLSTAEYQISYQWDGSGHLTQETISGSANPGQNHSRTYQWNAAGQLIGISQGATALASYRYSGQSLRDKTQTASGTSHTVWDGEFAYLLQDQHNHTLTRTEHHGLNPLVVHADSAYKEVLLKDGLQSVTASVQAADSALQSQSEYDAWGQRAQQGSSASRHGYTGHLHDSESGLIYARARYYNPMLGRFISQDPLEGILNSPITWNAYLYGNGNPLIYIDQNGEIAILADGANMLGSWGDWLKDYADEHYSGSGAGSYAGQIALGLGRGIVGGAEGLTRSANFGANTISVSLTGNQAHSDELDRSFAAMEGAIGYLRQEGLPGTVGRAVDTAVRAASGDASAAGDITSVLTGITSGGAATRGASLSSARAVTAAAQRTHQAVAELQIARAIQKGASEVAEGAGLGAAARLDVAVRVQAAPVPQIPSLGARSVANSGAKSLGLTELDPMLIRTTQTTVKQQGATIPKLVDSMRQNGSVVEPDRLIDIVRMPDGMLTSLDNTRILAAQRAGVKIQARVFDHADALPNDLDYVSRFIGRKGEVPATFGEAVQNRISNQNSVYRNLYPYGSPFIGSAY